MILKRKEICTIAKSLIGTPYAHAQKSEWGTDCANYAIMVGEKLGLRFQTVDMNYSRVPDGQMLLKLCTEMTGRSKDITEAKPGDILLMRFNEAPQHIAILVEDDYIVHAYMRARKVVMERFNDTWKERVIKVFEYPNVEQEQDEVSEE